MADVDAETALLVLTAPLWLAFAALWFIYAAVCDGSPGHPNGIRFQP